MNDVKQQIAETEAKLARLKEKDRKLENGQKIVIGGAVMAEMKDNREFAITVLEMLERRLTRKTDVDRVAPIVEKNKKKIEDNNSYPNQKTEEQKQYEQAIEP